MHCVNCGATLSEGARFCEDCGHPVAASAPVQQAPSPEAVAPSANAAMAASASAVPDAAQATAQGTRRGIGIGLGIAAAAVAVGVGLFAVLGNGGSDADDAAESLSASSQPTSIATSDEPSSAAQAAQSLSHQEPEASSSQTTQAPEPEPGPAPTPAAEAEPAPAASLVDLSNPDDYYALNIFLSNFTEWDEFWSGWKAPHRFDRTNPDTRQLVNWGMWHVAINNDGTLQNGERQVDGAPPASWYQEIQPTGTPANTYLRWMDTELVRNAISRYIGLDLDLTGYDSGNGDYFESGGVMYEGVYRGAASPLDNVALATSVSSSGPNIVQVDFDVYCGYHQFGTVIEDKSWYGMSPEQLMAAMQAAGSGNVAIKHGTAEVEVVGSGTDRAFKLASFEVND